MCGQEEALIVERGCREGEMVGVWGERRLRASHAGKEEREGREGNM